MTRYIFSLLRYVVLGACFICVTGCGGGTAGTGGVPLEGRVASLDGSAIPGASVVLESEGVLPQQFITNAQGRFDALINPTKTYQIHISVSGAAPVVAVLAADLTTPGNIVSADFKVVSSETVEVSIEIRPQSATPTPTLTATAASTPQSTPTARPAVTPTTTPTAIPTQSPFPAVIAISDVRGAVEAQDGFIDALDNDQFANQIYAGTFQQSYSIVHKIPTIDSLGRASEVAVVALEAVEGDDDYEVLFGVAIRNPIGGSWAPTNSLVYICGYSVRFAKSNGQPLPAAGNSSSALSSFTLPTNGGSVSFTVDLRNVRFVD
ncbi:MAG: carboxypeptidase regulatory-like domain-containing protein [Deltaproteobacteria bacterium]|nr:carboxypeptidase regulatory-like domain-containing protein [Deltaproteobacteria bacterium]